MRRINIVKYHLHRAELIVYGLIIFLLGVTAGIIFSGVIHALTIASQVRGTAL